MIAQGFGFTRDFLKERNNSAYFRLKKIPCGFIATFCVEANDNWTLFKDLCRASLVGRNAKLIVRD